MGLSPQVRAKEEESQKDIANVEKGEPPKFGVIPLTIYSGVQRSEPCYSCLWTYNEHKSLLCAYHCSKECFMWGFGFKTRQGENVEVEFKGIRSVVKCKRLPFDHNGDHHIFGFICDESDKRHASHWPHQMQIHL